MISRLTRAAVLACAVCALMNPSFAESDGKPLVLQEMTWTDVRDYLTRSTMVIIPLGSTEQHGPHMPLGTDWYVATEASKAISARTGVMVAPVLMSGYSVYHSGFPGTLSVKPETMAQVLFESAQMLIKYGFRRFLFFSYHGGNRLPQETVISKINQETEAIAVAIGAGSFLQQSEEEGEFFDWHAGVEETSVMLYLKPELVKMDRAQKSIVHFTPQMEELRELAKKDKELLAVWSSLFGVPEETQKGGSSKDLTNNGVWSFSDPKTATAAKGEKAFLDMVGRAAKLVEAWKKAKK